MADVDEAEILLKGVTELALESEPSRDLCDWMTEQKNLNVTVLAGRPRNRIKPAREPWAWLTVEDLGELSWSSHIKMAHILSDHLENSSNLFCLSNVTNLAIHLLGKEVDERDIEVFHNVIFNLASGRLARLQFFVTESALDLAQSIFKWPGTKLVVTIEVVPTRARPRGTR